MANLFDKMIEDIKAVNGGKEDEVIAALRAKSAELGDDASENDITEAIRSCLTEYLSDTLEDGEPVSLSEESMERLKCARATVEEFLNDNKWHYSTREVRSDIVLYELYFVVNNISLRVRIHVETDPDVCQINAVFPVSADATYEYPVCRALVNENYRKRFGSFKYDERDGEISFEYSFITRRGIDKEDLGIYFNTVMGSAVSGYENIRKCCIGRFKNDEVTEMLKKINALVSDIS